MRVTIPRGNVVQLCLLSLGQMAICIRVIYTFAAQDSPKPWPLISPSIDGCPSRGCGAPPRQPLRGAFHAALRPVLASSATTRDGRLRNHGRECWVLLPIGTIGAAGLLLWSAWRGSRPGAGDLNNAQPARAHTWTRQVSDLQDQMRGRTGIVSQAQARSTRMPRIERHRSQPQLRQFPGPPVGPPDAGTPAPSLKSRNCREYQSAYQTLRIYFIIIIVDIYSIHIYFPNQFANLLQATTTILQMY